MNRLSILAAALAASTAAFSQTLPEAHIDLSNGQATVANNLVVYAGIPGPYSAFAASGGVLGQDDYQASPALMGVNQQISVSAIRFVGGVSAVGGILDFFFLDAAGANVVNSFGVALPSAGDVIWTITLGQTFLADRNGRLQIQARTGTTGRWFFTTTAPTVGTNSLAVGTGSALSPQRNNAFEITGQPVPEPGTMLALGAGVAFLARRRRK